MEGGKEGKWGIYVILSAIKKTQRSLKKPEDAHLEWALHPKMCQDLLSLEGDLI